MLSLTSGKIQLWHHTETNQSMLRSEHTQLQSFRERFPAAFKQGQMMCCGYFLQHEAEFAAFWGGAGNRCDPPTCQRPPPHPSPDTHTHTFKQFSACRGRVLFQRLVTWSVFNWGSFNRTREAFSLPTLTLSTYHRLILIIGVTLGSHRLLMTQILCNNHDALNDQGGLQLGSPLLREKDVFVSSQVSWLTGGSCLCSTTDVKRNYRDDALGIIMWKKRGNEHCFILTVTVNIFYRFRCVWHINLSRCWQDFWLMLHFINDFVCRLCEIVVLSLLYDFWQFCLSIWKEWSWHN